jgi:UTP:GlnB (protein PII) uridylyltransferase
MTTPDTIVLNRLRSLLKERVSCHKLVLFGSRARGEATPYSDMDVLIVVEGPATDPVRDLISDCAWEAGFEHGIVVVPIVYSRDEWETGPERHSLLAQVVAAEGVPV